MTWEPNVNRLWGVRTKAGQPMRRWPLLWSRQEVMAAQTRLVDVKVVGDGQILGRV